MTFEEIIKGNIPSSLEEKTLAASNLVYISRRIVPVTSLLIASARRDNFPRDVSGWIAWCRTSLELEGSDRDHRRAIGDLLLDTRDQTVVYNTLFLLPFDKLLAMTRIPADQVAAFLSHYKVAEMDREKVRKAVAEWLCEAVKEKEPEPELTGFEEALAAIGVMKPAEICVQIADETVANSALSAGLGLLGASLEWHKREKRDLSLLQGLRASLLDEVKALEEIISDCCTQHDVVHNSQNAVHNINQNVVHNNRNVVYNNEKTA